MPGGKERILLHLKISKARKKLWKKQDCGAAVDSFFPHSSALQDATDAVAFKSMTFRAPGRSETHLDGHVNVNGCLDRSVVSGVGVRSS